MGLFNYKKVKRFVTLFIELSVFKTLYFNIRYVPYEKILNLPILVSRHVRIRSAKGKVMLGEYRTGSIRLGFDNVGVFDSKRSYSIWEVSNGIVEFKGSAVLGNGFKICVHNNGKLVLGNKFELTAESTIICYRSIEFGNGCLVSWDSLIMDTDFHYIYSLPFSPQAEYDDLSKCKPIRIDDKVWICCRALILKGSHVPTGCVIAAGATITKDLPISNSLYSNNKLIKKNIGWSK